MNLFHSACMLQGVFSKNPATLQYLIIIMSAERRPLLGIGLPQGSPHNDQSCAVRIQRLPATFARSSVHLVWSLPTERRPVCGRHSRTFPPQRPSVLRAM
ncbi:hypothetical protein PYW08_016562 [Mythimna loreyi]|uniref:Uncharacterized protein n=1 Tax=Mythimna loreyi TaxID=667449 RepID=A0ACC2QZS3_9NEOP|nr:hypothetical protein PYW08_016562 [Mythimna loreyi]